MLGIPLFILSVGNLPKELLDKVFDYLLPPRLRGKRNCRKLWLDSMNRILFRDWIPSSRTTLPGLRIGKGKITQFCFIQGIAEKLYRISRGGTFSLRMLEGKTPPEVARKLLDLFLTFVGKNLVVQLTCCESKRKRPVGVCQAAPQLRRAKLTPHSHLVAGWPLLLHCCNISNTFLSI
jgi:hypothetical protein